MRLDAKTQLSPLAQATGRFIHELAAWRWWVTLTFRKRVSEEVAMKAFETWEHRLAELMQTHVTTSWAGGPQSGGNPHFHVLLSWKWDSGVFSQELARLLWRGAHDEAGDAHAREYDSNAGAPWYHAKHPWLGFTLNCPRFGKCRRNCEQRKSRDG